MKRTPQPVPPAPPQQDKHPFVPYDPATYAKDLAKAFRHIRNLILRQDPSSCTAKTVRTPFSPPQTRSVVRQNHAVVQPSHFATPQNRSVVHQNHPAPTQNHPVPSQPHSFVQQNHFAPHPNHSVAHQNHWVAHPTQSALVQKHLATPQTHFAPRPNDSAPHQNHSVAQQNQPAPPHPISSHPTAPSRSEPFEASAKNGPLSTFKVQSSTFDVQRSTFNVRRSTFPTPSCLSAFV